MLKPLPALSLFTARYLLPAYNVVVVTVQEDGGYDSAL